MYVYQCLDKSISHISPKMKDDLRLLHSTVVVILVLES